MKCTVAKQYILQQKCLNKWIENTPLRTRFYNFQPPTLTLQTPQTAHPTIYKFYLFIISGFLDPVTILFMLLQIWENIVIMVVIN